MVLVASIIGALIGGAARPLPEARFLADAVLTFDSSDGPTRAQREFRTLDAIVKLPQIAAEAAADRSLDVSESDVTDRVTVVGDPRSGVLRVRARGESPAAAAALADAVAARAVALRSTRTKVLGPAVGAKFDFQTGTEGFTAGSRFSLPATDLVTAPSGEANDDRALSFRCRRPSTGCGPGIGLVQRFVAGTRYVAQMRIRSVIPPAAVRIVLGSNNVDVASGAGRVIPTGRYVPLTIAWTPERTQTSVTLAVQTTNRRRAWMRIDDVAVVPSPGPATDASAVTRSRALGAVERTRATAEDDSYVSLGSATASGTVRATSAKWAAGGLLIGALGALAGLLLAHQARRRQQQAPRKPDAKIESITR